MDVYMTTGPWLGKFNGTLPLIIIKPALVGVALGILFSILVFPESCSSQSLTQVNDLLGPCKHILEMTAESLKCQGANLDDTQLSGQKRLLVMRYEKLGQSFGFLPLEPNVCRWNANDIKGMKPHLRMFMIRLIDLLNFHVLRLERRAYEIHEDENGNVRTKSKEREEKYGDLGDYQNLVVRGPPVYSRVCQC